MLRRPHFAAFPAGSALRAATPWLFSAGLHLSLPLICWLAARALDVRHLEVARGRPVTLSYSPAVVDEQTAEEVSAAVQVTLPPPLPEPAVSVAKRHEAAPIAEIPVVDAPQSANLDPSKRDDLARVAQPPASERSETPPSPLRRAEIAVDPLQAVAVVAALPATVGVEYDEPPRKLSGNAPPVYPSAALSARIEGRVLLRVTVSPEGRVAHLSVAESSGSRLLDDSAAAAVRGWRFAPAARFGRSVSADVLVPVRFTIRG